MIIKAHSIVLALEGLAGQSPLRLLLGANLQKKFRNYSSFGLCG